MSPGTTARTRGRVVIISNVAWDHLWQRHQGLACQFARESDVLYIEIPGVRRAGLRDLGRIARRLATVLRGNGGAGSREPRPAGLEILRPPVVPSTNWLFHAINRVVMGCFVRRHVHRLKAPELVVAYSAARAALHLISLLSPRRLVYDCTDNFGAIRGLPACFREDENRLLRRADLTLVPGESLAALHRAVARRLEVLPHGAEVDRFLPGDIPRAARAEGRPPTLIYYGHMHRQHFDFELVDAVAREHPQWRVVLVGPVVTPQRFPANVELVGAQPHERLRDHLAGADVIILPYAINGYTSTVLPAKTYECLATGMPIVSTPLPELQRAVGGLVSFASDARSFGEQVEKALGPQDAAAREARMSAARSRTWAACHARFLELVERIPEDPVGVRPAGDSEAGETPEIRLADLDHSVRTLAELVLRSGFRADVVVYIERGARLLAYELCRCLDCPAIAVTTSRGAFGFKRIVAPVVARLPRSWRDWLRRQDQRWLWSRDATKPRRVVSEFSGSLQGRRVLLVDDAADSGRTIAGCRIWLGARGVDAADIRVAVLAATTPAGRAAADFWIFDRNTRLPWSSDSVDRIEAEAAYRQNKPRSYAPRDLRL